MPAEAMPIGVTQYQDAEAPYLSAHKLASTLGLSLADLAALAGASYDQIAAGGDARLADAALSPVVRILALASEMAGSEARAALWFKHQPIPGWAGKTAYDLVAEQQAGKVLNYLEAVRSGVYA